MNQLERTISSLEVAEMVGRRHDNVMSEIRNIISHLGDDLKIKDIYFIESEYIDKANRTKPCYRLTKKGCELYGTRMTGAKGTQFAVKYIERFNELEQFVKDNISYLDEKKIAFETHLIGVEYASKILNVDNTSKIKMLEEAHKHHGVPTNHLPQYVDEEVTMSLTALLKKYGVKMGAAKFNTKLIELGILEIKERPSSKGGVKEFKSITEKGLYYGKNLINPKSPKETQPHYYESKFSELLRIVVGEAA